MVTFCDEPKFSEIAIRDCFDDEAKLIKLAKNYMPESYIVKGGQSGWESAESRHLESEGTGPWYVKETNKNGGRVIQMCNTISDCMELANNPQETYFLQRHIPNPHLTKDGRKWYFKLYCTVF